MPLILLSYFQILGVKDYDAVLRFFSAAKQELGEILSAFEFMDSTALALSVDYFKLRYICFCFFSFYITIYICNAY